MALQKLAQDIRSILAESNLVVTVYHKGVMYCQFVCSSYEAPVCCTAPEVDIATVTDTQLVQWTHWDQLRRSYDFIIPEKYEFITEKDFVVPEDNAFREYITCHWWALRMALDAQSLAILQQGQASVTA